MSVAVFPGNNIQSIIDSYPNEDLFVFQPGKYTGYSLKPRDGITLQLQPGVIISGFKRLDKWTPSGSGATCSIKLDITDKNMIGKYEIFTPENPRAGWNIALFVDGEPLRHVAKGSDVKAGTYMYDAGNIYIGFVPTHEIIEVTETPHFVIGAARNVTITGYGSIIEGYRPPVQMGAIHLEGEYNRVEGPIIRRNTGNGLNIGSFGVIKGCIITENGIQGFGMKGESPLIEECDVTYYNFLNSALDFTAAGAKISNSDGAIVRHCRFAFNQGNGLWFDVNNANFHVHNCVVHDNARRGIYSEVGCSGMISGNWVGFNQPSGGSGITAPQIAVSSASGTTIFRNVVVVPVSNAESAGIGLIQTSRGSGDKAWCNGEWLTRDSIVEDNDIYIKSGSSGRSFATGGYANHKAAEFFNLQNNSLRKNRIHFEALAEASNPVFVWANLGAISTGAAKTLAQVQTLSKQEIGSTVDTIPNWPQKFIPSFDLPIPQTPGNPPVEVDDFWNRVREQVAAWADIRAELVNQWKGEPSEGITIEEARFAEKEIQATISSLNELASELRSQADAVRKYISLTW